ncbi:hypothetical protein HO173_010854 [Letharia columbiana]|uniref:Uncharacterized protein n=1 Tax=Letharia columbiana TaxID=112416 RepID=A0A8H6FLW2_9LECA|nr:uncharacterized protein HO173_010854 [Letharia columbiana]KAF6230946.1 hypothetical protein HO173_010854 [Letharia columbiana]
MHLLRNERYNCQGSSRVWQGAEAHAESPTFGAKTAFGEFETGFLASLSENLDNVKWEVSGDYRRYDLESIFENGLCHWKYKMIDEKKQRQKKAELNRQEEEARSEHQGDGRVEASSNAQETNANEKHGNGYDEMIDDDDGYVIRNDGRQVEDNAGDVSDDNGEDAGITLDNKIHTAADDSAVDSEMMLWE